MYITIGRYLVNTIGRKALLVIAQCLFLVGSVSCSATQDMMQMVLSRMVAGLGGGMLLPLSSIVISDFTLHDQQSPSVVLYYERYHIFIRTAPAVSFVLVLFSFSLAHIFYMLISIVK